MLAAKTTVPVLGVPVPSRHLQGQDSLLSIVQMPAGVPVATFAIGEAGATNAALFAVAMLAADDAALAAPLARLPRRPPRPGGGVDAAAAVTDVDRPAGDDRRCSAAASSAATRVVAARLMGYGTVVLDPDPAAPAGARRRRAPRRRRTTTPPRSTTSPRRAPSSRPSSRTRRPPRSSGSPRDVVVAPPAAAVAIAQDRIAEKRFLAGLGVPTAPFAVPGDGDAGVAVPGDRQDGPARLRRQGPARRRPTRAELDAALAELAVPCVVEQRVPLDAELSVIVARTADGRHVALPGRREPPRRRHPRPHRRAGPRRRRTSPPRPSALAGAIAERLDYVGVLAVEMFVSDGRLLVNELAPRPHNSGHWTLDAAVTSQFEQQVRAVCGLALGPTDLTARRGGDGQPARRPCGRAASRRGPASLAEPDARLHLYGKAAARPGRKMGHLTVLGDDADDVADARRSRCATRRVDVTTLIADEPGRCA